MGYPNVRRWLLLGSATILLGYLLLNLLLNASFLPAYVDDRVEALSGRPARVSYLYLNWRGNPVAHRVRIGAGDTGPRLSLHRVETVVHWMSWLRRGRSAAVSELRIHRAAGRLTGALRRGPTSAGNGVRVPIRVRRWRVSLEVRGVPAVQIAGDSALVSPSGAARLHVDRVGARSADVDVSVRSDGVDAAVHRLSLPNSFWALEGDRWRGTLRWRPSDGVSRFRMSLRGSPGRLRGVSLPPLDMSLQLDREAGRSVVRDLSLSAPYLRLSMAGNVSHDPLRLDLIGEARAPLRDQLQRVLFRDVSRHVAIRSMSPVEARVRIAGTPANPAVSGDVSMTQTRVALRGENEERMLTLRDVRGEVGYGWIRLTGGIGSLPGQAVAIRRGRLSLAEGVLWGGVSLDYRAGHTPVRPDLPARVTGALGDLREARLPVNLSFRVGTERAGADLSIRGGSVAFERMAFRGIRLRTGMDSRGRFDPRLRASLEDADGNRWTVSGHLRGPLFLRGTNVRMERWMQVLPTARLPGGDPAVWGFDVRGVLPQGYGSSGDYSLRFEFEDARLRLARRSLGLAGTLDWRPGSIRMDHLRLRGSKGTRLRVWGDVATGGSTGPGHLDLKLDGHDVDLRALLGEEGPAYGRVRSNLDLEGRIRGTPVDPRYRVTFHRGRLRGYGLRVEGFQGRVEGDSGWLRAEFDRLRLGEGTGTAVLEWRSAQGLDVNARLRGVPPAALVRGGSWVGRNVTGRLNAGVELSGRLHEPDSWVGSVRLEGRDLRLARFPPVEGIEEIARIEALRRPIVLDPVAVSLPVEAGRLSLDPLRLTGSELALGARGHAGFDGTLDLQFVLALEGSMLKRFMQDVLGDLYREVGINEEPRRLECPFVVRGTVSHPDIELQRDRINKNFRENLINSVLTERIGKPINELLEEIPFLR